MKRKTRFKRGPHWGNAASGLMARPFPQGRGGEKEVRGTHSWLSEHLSVLMTWRASFHTVTFFYLLGFIWAINEELKKKRIVSKFYHSLHNAVGPCSLAMLVSMRMRICTRWGGMMSTASGQRDVLLNSQALLWKTSSVNNGSGLN